MNTNEINVSDLIEVNANCLRDRNGELIGRNGSANADDYPAFESVKGNREERQRVAADVSTLIENYEEKYGEKPPENLLAAAVESVKGLSAMVLPSIEKEGMALESVDGSTTTADGVIETLNRTNIIAMEYDLDGVLSQLATTFPSGSDETHLFELERRAGKNWNGITKDDPLGITFAGKLSELDPALEFVGNGTLTAFTLPAAHPVFEKKAEISLNMYPAGKDDGGFSGSKTIGGQLYTITGSITDYTTGEGTLTVTPAMPATVTARITRPLNLEDTEGEKWIQSLIYKSKKRIVTPVENSLDITTTFHAGLAFQRDLGMDIWAYGQRDMLRTVAADRSYNAIRLMYQASQHMTGGIGTADPLNNDASLAFSTTSPAGVGYSPRDHVITTLPIWLWLQGIELQTNSIYGFLTDIVAGNNFIRLLNYLPPELFRKDPGYRDSHDIVYYGTLFGKYKIFYDAKEKIVPADEILMLAKSTDQVFHNGFLNSTAIPLNTFSFQMTKLMTRHKRVWTRVYRRLEDPAYFRRAKIS
ncbi:hypothetical protein KAR91_55740 [Candidatus Pacearchaeota archaeon]|nr:hypothetical protein [Candidatus Pacearchaeota archaeon]